MEAVHRRGEKLILDLLERGELAASGSKIILKFKEYIGCEYCIAFDHGHTALMAAYYAVGVGPGDEVITPVAGYIGTYVGALFMGARPVFCEIDPKPFS